MCSDECYILYICMLSFYLFLFINNITWVFLVAFQVIYYCSKNCTKLAEHPQKPNLEKKRKEKFKKLQSFKNLVMKRKKPEYEVRKLKRQKLLEPILPLIGSNVYHLVAKRRISTSTFLCRIPCGFRVFSCV